MTISPYSSDIPWRLGLTDVTTRTIPEQRISTRTRELFADSGALSRLAGRIVVASLAVLAVLQLVALGALDPLRTTVSELVYAPGGSALFPLAGMMCVAGSVMLVAVLARRRAVGAAAVLGVWCLGLLLATVCPTDPPMAATVSLAAEVHRDAAAAMFVALPIAGYLVARRSLRHGRTAWVAGRGPAGAALAEADPAGARWAAASPAALRLRRASIICALAGIAQLAVSLPSLFAGTALADSAPALALFEVRGLAERLLFVAMIMVVVRMAQVLRESGSFLHCTVSARRPDWSR